MARNIGLPGYAVVNEAENSSGITFRLISTRPERVCDECGSVSAHIKGHETHNFRDLEHHGKFCWLEITAPRYKCLDCGKTFNPKFTGFTKRFHMTLRLRDKIREECFSHPFNRIALMHGFNDPTIIKRIFDEYMLEMDSKWKPVMPRVLGIDEAHLAKEMRCVFVELNKNGNNRLIEMAEDRKTTTVKRVLRQLQKNSTGRYYPDVVTMDFTEGYRKAVSEVFGSDTKIVIDRFHVQQLILKDTSEAYKSIKTNMDKDFAALDPEERHKLEKRWKSAKISVKLFRINREDLSSSQRTRLATAIKIYPKLGELYNCKEDFRAIYNHYIDREDAEAAYSTWKDELPDTAEYKPFHKTTETIARWYDEVFNYFDTGRYTNGPVEAINGVIKEINRIGRGYSYPVIRAKVLYRNPATEKPVFVKPKIVDGVFDENGLPKMEFAMGDYTPSITKGSGVNIQKLLTVLETAESFDDF